MASYALTGGATGIGAALKQQLISAGHQVITVDIKEGDIIADLSTLEGRQAAIEEAYNTIFLAVAANDGAIGRALRVCNAVIGGLAVGTLLTLIVVPALYAIFVEVFRVKPVAVDPEAA